MNNDDCVSKKEIYDAIVFLICSYGNHFDKKHGKWVKLQYTNDSFFQLDTWNNSVCIKQGSGDYEYWVGFKGSTKQNLGIDFGGFECNVSLELLQFHLDNINSITVKNKYIEQKG